MDSWLATVALVVVLLFFISRIWMTLATGGYILPKDADDWGAWGTWIGGLATAAAFIYTALQIREQRANRIADEARTFNALKIKSLLVVPRLNGVGRSGGFIGHPTNNPNENSRLIGHEHLIKVTNGSDTAISAVSVGFNDHLALSPLASVAQPTWKLGNYRGVEISRLANVPALPSDVIAIGVSQGWAMGVHCDVIQPGTALSFNLVFRKSSKDLVLTWVKFTDSAGFTWYRDLKSDEIIYIPQDTA